MNQTFNFKRFSTYFKYDLTQMWRNHSKAAILIGGASAIFYILWVMFSLVFNQQWQSPVAAARLVVFSLAFLALELYQVRTYGYITDKKAGSSWLMIPASRAEKFVSMLLISLVVVPLLFFVVYMLLDGFISLVDPTYGKALITGFSSAYDQMMNVLTQISEQTPIIIKPSTLIIPAIVSYCCNFLYFLLCGICFKRNKLVGAIAILFLISTVSSLVMGFFVPDMAEYFGAIDEENIMQYFNQLITICTCVTGVMTLGLGWGVWYRIKTLQH